MHNNSISKKQDFWVISIIHITQCSDEDDLTLITASLPFSFLNGKRRENMDVAVCNRYIQIIILLKKVMLKTLNNSVFFYLDPPKPFGIMTAIHSQMFTQGTTFSGPCGGRKI